MWAPSARAVSVIGDWNDWRAGADPLMPRESSGIWEGRIGVGQGARYKYAITGPSGDTFDKADPFAARAEHPPATASVVWQAHHHWQDAAWMRSRGARQSRSAPISIYECHLGSWRRDRGEVLGYRELGIQLAHHCAQLGFTHVELLPVMEHPFYGSWGYQVTGFFAPTSRYGAPDDLMAMIDELHRANIGVILDWVPAHFPTDAHGLGNFDGTHLFEHADPRRGFHPDWTSYIFNYARHEVRAFLISSAMSWLDRFHADGLRVDGVASMLYRDYSRKPGEWVPNEDGKQPRSRRDQLPAAAQPRGLRGVPRRADDRGGVDRVERRVAPARARRPRLRLQVGPRLDARHAASPRARAGASQVAPRRAHVSLGLREQRELRAAAVARRGRARQARADRQAARRPVAKICNHAVAVGYQWTLPGKKLVFMGDELAVWREWNHDVELDWAVGLHPAHSGIARWLGDLNAAYRAHRSLHVRDCDPIGFQWLVGDDVDTGVIAYLRTGEADDVPVCVVCNFTPVPRDGYRLGVPRAGFWREVLCSDAEIYGGSGIGNRGGMQAEEVPWHGQPHSIVVTAPPLGVVVFVAA